MSDTINMLSPLRRPRLLVRAARMRLADYNRDHCLRRLLPTQTFPAPGHALSPLVDAEQQLNEERCAGAAGYSVTRHIELLAALMVESQFCNQNSA